MIVREFIFGLITLIPTFQIEAGSSILNIVSWAGFMNHYIPVDIFVRCLGTFFATWLSCAIISTVLQLL